MASALAYRHYCSQPLPGDSPQAACGIEEHFWVDDFPCPVAVAVRPARERDDNTVCQHRQSLLYQLLFELVGGGEVPEQPWGGGQTPAQAQGNVH